MNKVLSILSAIREPRTIKQLEDEIGGGVYSGLKYLERDGAARRIIHDRQDDRAKQQRRYITLFVATGKPYTPRRLKNEEMH